MQKTVLKEKIFLETEKTIVEFTEMIEPVAPDNVVGRISRMDAINNKSVTGAALRQAKEKLNNFTNNILIPLNVVYGNSHYYKKYK